MKISLLGALIFSLTIGPGWCQSAPARTAAELAKNMAADRERVLYDGAKKEGKLVWYTSLTIYKEMAKFFEAKYPASAWNSIERRLSIS